MKSGTTGSTPVRGKPSASSSGAVVLGVAEREIAAVDVGGQLAPAAEAQLDEVLVDADEVLRRRDVVVDERHAARAARRRSARRASRSRSGGSGRRPGAIAPTMLAVVDASAPRAADRRSRRRSPTRSRRRAARAGCRAPRGRWRRRSRAWRGPDGRAARRPGVVMPIRPLARLGLDAAPGGRRASTAAAAGRSRAAARQPAGQRLDRAAPPCRSAAARTCRDTCARSTGQA